MPQSLSRVIVHLVFSTKNRESWIIPSKQKELFSYIAGTLNNIECPSILVGGMPDHVHLLFAQSRTLSISKIVEEIKKHSSKWAKERIHEEFYWQAGYGVFSVSASNVSIVENYILNQENHHSKMSFQNEFLELLRKHNLEWDERYLWD
jgi:putative transposase